MSSPYLDHGSSRPARICHVQVLPLLSGVQRVMLEILKQLDRSRYEIHVACQGPGPLTDELERRDIRWHAVPQLARAIHPIRDWQAYRALYDLFSTYRFDIVHTHSSKPGVLGRLAARQAGVPAIVHHVHAFAFHDYSSRLKHWIYGGLERWAGRYCDRVLFVNHEERELSIRRGLLPADKCLTVYNGVDLDAFDPAPEGQIRQECRRRWQLDDQELGIVFVGRLDYPKQPLLIPVIAQHLERLRPHRRWRFLVAGSGSKEAAVNRLVTDWNLQHRVRLLGWQDHPDSLLQAADIVLLTSLAEGLPCALIEAQATGRPIVAGEAKGVREVVTPDTGLLCPPKDPLAYAEHLARLIDDAELRQQYGRAARRHAEGCFDSTVNYARTAAIYEELLSPAVGRKPARAA
jgi:glycosyltransferase involved in cell wall biosynthesis